MVAAWISAETGVGPSMASGSQTCRGNWADLPTAPQKSRSVIEVKSAGLKAGAAEKSALKSSVPMEKKISRMPKKKPMSPARVKIKAFLAAAAAEGFSNQKPIRKYEHRPTSSQKIYINNRLLASTRPSIAAQKSER